MQYALSQVAMTLRDALEAHGRWLFRHRGPLPLLLLPVFVAAMADPHGALGVRPPTPIWEVACLAIAFAGLAARIATVGFVPAGTSGRNTASQVAEVLNTTGMYSIVRHPLYLGNAVITIGVVCLFRCWWLVAIVLLTFSLYYERIMLAEEAFLRERFGHAFESWAARVPAVVPSLRLWGGPAMPFSWRTAIRREYHGVVAILAAFAGLRSLGSVALQRPPLDAALAAYLVVGALVFFVCRFLKKHTRVLRVQGR